MRLVPVPLNSVEPFVIVPGALVCIVLRAGVAVRRVGVVVD